MRLTLASMFLTGALALPAAAPAASVTQTITYQGELNENGVPKNGTIDVIVKIFDAVQDGAQFETKSFADVPVTRGLFTLPITLDNLIFFEGGDWWLQIAVRDGALSGAEPHTVLSPRQLITSVPYAINADAVDGLGASSLLKISQATAFKHVVFEDEAVAGWNEPSNSLATLHVVAPAVGTVVFRARGNCALDTGSDGLRQGVLLAIGTSEADSSTSRYSYGGSVNVQDDQNVIATRNFTAERSYSVSSGQPIQASLFAGKSQGTSPAYCWGTLSAEFFASSF